MKQGIFALALAALVISIVGCAAPLPKREEVFFPEAPDLPRFQYLTSFTGSADIQEQSAFDVFVAGIAPKVGVSKPYGVAIYDGKIYVCDTNSTAVVFDLKNKAFHPIAGANGQGKLLQPTNISIDKNGNKYVTDIARGQVVIFDKADAFVRAVGLPKDWRPTAAVSFEDRLYVSDAKNSEIVVFDMQTFNVIKRFGGKSDEKKILDTPTNLAFDKEGNLYVTDAFRFQILKFDRDGHLLSTIGTLGDSPGYFNRPRGIDLDRENRLYVVDAAYNNLQIFDKNQQLLMFFGGPGPKKGNIQLPAGVTIDYDNLSYFEKYISPTFAAEYLVVVTSQFGPKRVNVFAYGKQKDVKYPTEQEEIERVKKLDEKFQKTNPPDSEQKKGEQGP